MALTTGFGVDTLAMKVRVDRVRSRLIRVERAPDRAEPLVVLAPAQRARAMPGREGGGFVEEEELRELARLKQRPAFPASELEPAGDPALSVVAPPDTARLVVQAAAIAVDEPTRGSAINSPSGVARFCSGIAELG
jgi:hypothetical protein